MVTLLALACRREDPPPPPTETGTPTDHTGAGDHTGEVTGPHTGGGTGDTGGSAVVEPGAWCAPETSLGLVQVLDTEYGPPALWVQLWDRVDPWIGAPAEVTPTCAFHTYTPATCGPCDPGEVCGPGGACVPERRTVKDVAVTLSAGGDDWTFETDPVLGQRYATLDPAVEGRDLRLRLTWGAVDVTVPATPIASGDLGAVHVRVARSDFDRPGALDATWDPPPDGGLVRSRIPINHHAAGPTFTECATDAQGGSFHATATMIDPLAVITGLEFQGLEHWQTAAVHLPDGCVDVRLGQLLYVSVEVP